MTAPPVPRHLKMHSCCVPLCKNTSRNKNIHFYRIPKDQKLRKIYDIAIRNKHLKSALENTRICSEHFEGGRRVGNAIPTIFPWTKPTKPRKPPAKRELEPPTARKSAESPAATKSTSSSAEYGRRWYPNRCCTRKQALCE